MYFQFKHIIKKPSTNFIRRITGLNVWNEVFTSETKHRIENHWRNKLPADSFIENDTTREKYYVLSMFPYPSGSLHMGHVRVYTISDTVARCLRMKGKNVLHPIGWDAFGLPAENAAIDRQISPDVWTKQNIAHMKQQLNELGCSFEWDREFATCDPEYYRWTQDLFLKLFDAGMVYQKEALVNWDPVDKTVLADEQVDENGCSWRSGATVEKKLLKQWFIRTTKFARNLWEGLDDPILQDWKDIIKLQKHWIGECNGVNFDFKVGETDEFVTFWTSKPEYIEQVKFVAVTCEHVLAKREGILRADSTVKLNTSVINPFTDEKLPVFVTEDIEFLPMTDSYLGIPDVFEEATDFAKKQNIPFGISNKLSNKDIEEKQQEMCEKAGNLGRGGYWTSAKLRDWLISRQRYWGTPIPIIHCEQCGAQAVPRLELPVLLPKLKNMLSKGGSPLKDLENWLNTECPKCRGPARRETDTMDTFVDSSWYFLRFIDPKNSSQMFSKEKAEKITPVDLYIGGKEHAVLHMYYARFISHFLHSLGLLKEKEPFRRLLVQGMVMGRSYRVKGSGEYLHESKVNVLDLKRNKAVSKETGEPVVISWEKMSKSKYNGVDPKDMFREYGVDTTRLLILADVAPTSHRNWNANTFPGILNWQKRLWLTLGNFLKHRHNPPAMLPAEEHRSHEDYLFDSRNYYVKGTSYNYLITQQLSIAVSKQQGLTNSLRKMPPAVFARGAQFQRALAAQLILLAPMAPFFASELWSGFVSAPNRLNDSEIRWDKPVFEQEWPETDMDYKLDLVFQVNGFENAVVKMARTELEQLSREEAAELALQQKEVQTTLTRRNVLDVVFTLHEGCEGVVNLITDQPPAKGKSQTIDSDEVQAKKDSNI